MAQAIPIVQTVGLTKVFRDFWRRPRVTAVSNLNIEIKRGEIFGLLGPNGSGKSTTIKLLLGLLYPTKGRIAVFGKPPTDVATKMHIGFLPEESYLYRFLNAYETLDFYGRLFKQSGPMRRDRIDKLLDMVGLRHEAKRPIGEYSKGMARRIGLAQALINDPDFLILDEPTTGLDPIGARQIKEVILQLKRDGKTLLLSSHLLGDVEDVCDRVSILYGGQQRAAGDIRDLLSQKDLTQLTTERLSPETIERVRKLLREVENKDILSVSTPSARLETLFLRIVHEAEEANIQTSGVRAVGEIPDFLKRREPEPGDVIGDLVAAGPRPEAVAPVEAPPAVAAHADDDASQRLIDALVAEPDRAETEPEQTGREEAPAAPPKPHEPVEADQGIINDLIGGGGDRGHG